MPIFPVEGVELDLPRNLALLDTNILIALADENDDDHIEARYFFELETRFVLGVAPPTIAEACSFLTGKRKRPDRAHWLLLWLLTPGTPIVVLPAPHGAPEDKVREYLQLGLSLMQEWRIDFVDAFLMHMANKISTHCRFSADLVIVTKDQRDFARCLESGLSYRMYDWISEEMFERP